MGKGKSKNKQTAVVTADPVSELADQFKLILRDKLLSVKEINSIASSLPSTSTPNHILQKQHLLDALENFRLNISSKASYPDQRLKKFAILIEKILNTDQADKIFGKLINSSNQQSIISFPVNMRLLSLVQANIDACVMASLINFESSSSVGRLQDYRYSICNMLFRVEILILHCSCLRVCNSLLLESAINSFLVTLNLGQSEYKSNFTALKNLFRDESNCAIKIFEDDTLDQLLNLRAKILDSCSGEYGIEFYKFLTLYIQNAFDPIDLADHYRVQINKFSADTKAPIIMPNQFYLNVLDSACDILKKTINPNENPEAYRAVYDTMVSAISLRQDKYIYDQSDYDKLKEVFLNACNKCLQ